MNREQIVLCVGLDWHLLSTRMQTLKSAGFQVVLARDENQARTATNFFRFQAAVLCHSLRDDLQQALTADMRTVQPDLPILQLQAHDQEPAILIAAVSKVIGSLAAESRARTPYLSCSARCTGLEKDIAN